MCHRGWEWARERERNGCRWTGSRTVDQLLASSQTLMRIILAPRKPVKMHNFCPCPVSPMFNTQRPSSVLSSCRACFVPNFGTGWNNKLKKSTVTHRDNHKESLLNRYTRTTGAFLSRVAKGLGRDWKRYRPESRLWPTLQLKVWLFRKRCQMIIKRRVTTNAFPERLKRRVYIWVQKRNLFKCRDFVVFLSSGVKAHIPKRWGGEKKIPSS